MAVGFWRAVLEGAELVWLEGGGRFVETAFGTLSDEDGLVGRGEGEDFWWWEFGCWFCHGGRICFLLSGGNLEVLVVGECEFVGTDILFNILAAAFVSSDVEEGQLKKVGWIMEGQKCYPLDLPAHAELGNAVEWAMPDARGRLGVCNV